MTSNGNDRKSLVALIANNQSSFAGLAWIALFERGIPAEEVVIICIHYCHARSYILERIFPHVDLEEMLDSRCSHAGILATTWKYIDTLFYSRPQPFLDYGSELEEGKVRLIVLSESESQILQISPKIPSGFVH